MSLQWTFIATFLYAEIFLVVLLLLPFISATRWQKIFRSRLLSSISSHANIYFNIFILVLIVLFLDSIRDVRRFSAPREEEMDLKNNPQAETLLHMRLFRAQRNFYIAGFALFLFLVLRRLVTLIYEAAKMEAELESMTKQAEGAVKAAQAMLDKSDGSAVDAGEDVDKIKNQLNQTKEEKSLLQKDVEAMKKQAESTSREYDRLNKEYAELTAKYEAAVGQEGSKKDD